MILLADATSWFMFTLGVALMIVILLRRWSRYYRGRRRSGNATKSFSKRTSREINVEQPLMDAPPNILRWQVEMHETARNLKAELDSKMGALQVLVQMAQEQSERLERAIERAERLGIAECKDTLEEIERLGDPHRANMPEAVRSLPPAPPAETSLPGKRKTTSELIYRLADQGIPPGEIARQVDVAIGEVEMILNLRPIQKRP